MRPVALVLLALALTCCPAAYAQSETAVSETYDPRSAVVRVRAVGLHSENGSEIGFEGSGYYASPDGVVVTTRHLLDELLKPEHKVDPRTARIEVSEGLRSPWVDADVIRDGHDFDYLILQVFVDGLTKTHLTHAQRARERVMLHDTPVYTAGFPGGDGYRSFRGVITSYHGPPEPRGLLWMWRGQIRSRNGQSGSPVYLSDGSVIGILRGVSEGDSEDVFIVPITNVSLDSGWTPNPISYGRMIVHHTARETERVTATRYAQNPHCAGDQVLTWEFEPSSGRHIERGSLHIAPTTQQGDSRILRSGVEPDGNVRIDVEVGNRGTCGPLWVDARGSIGLAISYTEVTEREEIVVEGRATPNSRILLGRSGEALTSLELVDSLGRSTRYSRAELAASPHFEIVTEGAQEFLVIQ